ncbi:leucine-rich repeat-containing G-protein coupled receptor 4-like [Paramacrobiotus metropolitanus]|uniref:leucine-rich repeat-containing G-protein coupled receptor 4-like n=1 Tax=Paramacrobiotus metropolitanus TaxID=2943436 RepID=UPI0024463C2F|nr:leucine-rich repeat-containing G-protein coupled receptor 4-like [Paramacrobiotus metropolitanus]
MQIIVLFAALIVCVLSLGYVIGECPSACSCDTDSRGRKRVRCDKGGLTIGPAFDPQKLDKDTLILSISAPKGATNPITLLNADHFKDLNLEEIHIRNTDLQRIGDRTFFYLSHSLKVLDLTGNKLMFIHENNFRNLSQLTHLHLDYNQLTDVHSATFNYQKILQVLTLSNNQIANIGTRLLLDQQNLEVIDLSGNPIHDIIPGSQQGAIPELMFPDAPRLRRASLAQTGINSLPYHGIARACKRLEELDVSRNSFTTISPGQFNLITSLRRLILAGNPLTSIQPGALANLRLDFLDLSATRLPLQASFFERAMIKSLSIASNNLQTIDGAAFIPIATDLTSVDVGGNPLTLKEKMFEFLPNLKGISLPNMRLARLPKNFLAYKHQIRSLNVSNNMFQELDEEILNALPDLEVLDISQNEIKTLPIQLARPGLRELYANNNQLKKVSDYFVDVFRATSSKMKVFRVFDNPLECDWSVGGLANWVGTSSGRMAVCGPDAGYRCPVCFGPVNVKGRTIDDIRVTVS